jgi:hypothetical protein
MGRELLRSRPRRTQRTGGYDALAVYIQARLRYGHTPGRFDYLALEPVYAALSTTVHNSASISSRR